MKELNRPELMSVTGGNIDPNQPNPMFGTDRAVIEAALAALAAQSDADRWTIWTLIYGQNA